MKKFISFSGGVESTTMCVLFGKDAKAIFADTGFEHKKLYERLDYVESQIKVIHPGFEIIRLKAKVMVKGVEVDNLPDYIRAYKYYPSALGRFCTGEFKIKPIDGFLSKLGECELMIGLNADEADKRTGNHGLMSNVNYTYPLLENGIGRTACEEILTKTGLHPSFPAYMARGGCVGCFFKSKKEYEAMALLSEEEFDMVAELEESIQDVRGRRYSIQKTIPNMKDFKRHAKSSLFDADEMYSVDDVHTSCGVFCHR